MADHLTLTRIGEDRFESQPTGEGRVFGGLFVAQALRAPRLHAR